MGKLQEVCTAKLVRWGHPPNTSRFSDGDAAVKEPSVTGKILRVSRKITGTVVQIPCE